MHSTTDHSTTWASCLQRACQRTALIGLTLVGLVSLLSLPASAAIYRTVDAAGNVTYTDQPPPGEAATKAGVISEQIEIETLNTFEKPAPESTYQPWLPDSEGGEDGAVSYQSLAITSPSHDEAFRNNAGNVQITAELRPGLQTGDAIHLEMDGSLSPTPAAGTDVQLTNVPRGTHRIRMVVLGPGGERKIESKEQVFHLQRYSVNQNRANN